MPDGALSPIGTNGDSGSYHLARLDAATVCRGQCPQTKGLARTRGKRYKVDLAGRNRVIVCAVCSVQ